MANDSRIPLLSFTGSTEVGNSSFSICFLSLIVEFINCCTKSDARLSC